MPLINLVIILIAVGVLLWLANTYIPMDDKIKAIVLWLLAIFIGPLPDIRVGR